MEILNSVKRGEVYYVDLGKTVGSEQQGLRPMLIIQNDIGNKYSPTVIGVPLTSRHKKKMPTHMYIKSEDCPGLTFDSIALFEQICTFDKTRIKQKVGTIPQKFNEIIYQKIAVSIG